MRNLSMALLVMSVATTALATRRELCVKRLAELRVGTPQLAEVSGNHHDTTYLLATWPLKQDKDEHQDDDPRSHGAYFLAGDIAATVVHYGRDERGIPNTDKPKEGTEFAIGWLLTELINNAAYHGNQGDEALPVRVRLVLHDDEAIVRISDQGAYFDVAPFSVEPDFAAMWDEYGNPTSGGSIGIRAILPGYVGRYGFNVVSEPRDDGDGVARTDVIVRVPLRQAMTVRRD